MNSIDQAEGPANFAGFQRDPFEAVPIRHELAEHREDSRGCLQLRLRLKPEPGLKAYLAKTFGFHRDIRVDLDQRGSFFWAQIDGKQNLHAIEKELRKEFDLNADDSRKATLMFTKALMLRHLILLDVGTEEEE
jgi:hypothetical protein